ncbi:MAG: hypothetical protein ING09_05230 [Roseomonas sp.]|jgi:hypothetical protein|nr:hypothetical protein [Roseomonas sp.]MCA3290549.1 hypothetical protein [Roseomonas sp.]MCA3293748.1 hypothetical protein [Roseomonas sp.]MCA3297359.1 hypothetical protein [Roseomonas sp.]MCA4920101.1 hypothetical protein [Roseomonas sp.]
MSFVFNPPNRYAALGGSAQATGTGSAKHQKEGLSISPESAVSRRGDLATALTLLLLGLGFLAASCLFIAGLVTTILA